MTTRSLHIDSIAHGGFGVAREDGRVVFVADAIPGETVEARIIEEKKSFARAVATAVLEPSPDRVEHPWTEARLDRQPELRAGGADFGHITIERQRALKAEVMSDAIARFGGGAFPAEIRVQGVDPDRAWRTRVSLHVAANGTAGPRAARSHEVIAVEDYPLAVPALAELAPWRERYPGADRVDLVATSTGEVVVRVLAPGEPVSNRRITETVAGRRFALAEAGFWQVHRSAAATLSAAVARALNPELLDAQADHLDLYGGVGLLAVPVLEAIGAQAKLSTVESAPGASEYAAENLQDWIGSRAIGGRVEQFLQREGVSAGATVVLDPPRAGAGREVSQRLARSDAAQIVYVACDPVAFARDLGTFREGGWDAVSLEAFDLFPDTHHVELVARLEPR
ncbi:MAG TPA: TRAM domain-containing protein [Microbacteriaceae bacterium]|nr:TRAM domain-containing protein [Microbacteriaceae bacterium]